MIAVAGSTGSRGATRAAQQGVSLLVVLMLLLVVTVLGLAAMRGTLMQERMAANAIARSNAFQTAEGALREAEAAATLKLPVPASGCGNGWCARPAPGDAPAWQQEGFWDRDGGWARVQSEVNDITAQYVIEDYGKGPESGTTQGGYELEQYPQQRPEYQYYRITVRSRSPNGAEVLLQSMLEVP